METQTDTKFDKALNTIITRFHEDPERAKITAINLTGIIAPLLTIFLLSVNYLFSPRAVQTDKEVNASIGLWVLNTVFTVIYTIIVFAALNPEGSTVLSSALLQVCLYLGYFHYLFIGVVLFNTYKFLINSEPAYPPFLSLKGNYTRILNNLNKQQTTT